jgi:hypothetical protein
VKALHILQIAWATMLLVLFELLAVGNYTWLRLAFFLLAAIYLWACLSTRRGGRLAWLVAALVPALVCIASLPFVAYFVWSMLWVAYHPITMTFTTLFTAVFLLPSLALMVLIWSHRAAIFARPRI